MPPKRKKVAAQHPPDRLRVAVCIDTRDGPGRERLLGVYEYAVQRNWNLFLVRQEDAAAVDQIMAMNVDGAILYDRAPIFHKMLQKNGVFCVETSARNLEYDNAAVFVDDDALGQLAAQHLASLNLDHYAYCGPSSHVAPSTRRGSAFSEYLKALGHTVDFFSEIAASGEGNLEPLNRWLRSLPKPIGILAFDDKIAERIVVACRWNGLRVPEEAAVLGVGNDELICELVEPKLSSVCLPTREIGRLTAEIIDARRNGREFQRLRSLPPTEVVARASSERLQTSDAVVTAAIELIRARAHRPFGTDQIVDALGVPRRTLERRFHASTGRTVHDFIIDFRLGLAKRLLRRTHGTVSEVSRQCGYTALSAFTRMFAERAGCHPDEYRRRSHQLG